jgi:hypothetical protein
MSIVAYEGAGAMGSFFWYYLLHWINPPTTIAAYTVHQIVSELKNDVFPEFIPYLKTMYYTVLSWYVLKLVNELTFMFRRRTPYLK